MNFNVDTLHSAYGTLHVWFMSTLLSVHEGGEKLHKSKTRKTCLYHLKKAEKTLETIRRCEVEWWTRTVSNNAVRQDLSCSSWLRDAWHLQHRRPHCTPKKPLVSSYFFHWISDRKAKDAKLSCLGPHKAWYFWVSVWFQANSWVFFVKFFVDTETCCDGATRRSLVPKRIFVIPAGSFHWTFPVWNSGIKKDCTQDVAWVRNGHCFF